MSYLLLLLLLLLHRNVRYIWLTYNNLINKHCTGSFNKAGQHSNVRVKYVWWYLNYRASRS